MARSTMTRLIDRVRTLTFAGTSEYSIGTANFWDDDHIQQILDDNRLDLYRVPLNSELTYNGGTAEYRVYTSTYQEWEHTDGGTAVFEVENSTGFTSGTANWTMDYQRGVLTFGADQGGTAYVLTGRVYDVYGAAAGLLEQWAAREARQFDVETPAVKAQRSQKARMLMEQAATYRARSAGNMGGATMYRSDA